MIKQSFTVLAAVVLLLLAVALDALPQVQTESVIVEPSIVVFYEEGCPGCELMEEFLSELVVGHGDLGIVRYEINEPGALDLLSILAAHYSVSDASVPILFVGDEAIVGTGRAEEIHLRTAVGDCVSRGCPSPLSYAEGKGFPWSDSLVLGAFAALFLFFFILQLE
ncbi:MAG: hypothetical protein U9N00_02120 [Candidatus Bipolaricaulota bacterium]|nr:hypothetical protein [Candidatus Bipolaricaulota bacterium]